MVDKDNGNLIIQFLTWTIQGSHVEYHINLFNDKIIAEFTQRYSSLRDFHEALKLESKDPNFPKFPPKKFFGNTDKTFLNQRKVGLQHYFSCILNKEFAHLKIVKNWVSDIFKKYGKPKTTSITAPKENENISMLKNDSQALSNSDEQSIKVKGFDHAMIAKRREIADKYSKNFIELSGDNVPNIDEESEKKEKSYKDLIKSANLTLIKNSELFDVINGNDSNFSSLGISESQFKILESSMLSKLLKISQEIESEIHSYYVTKDFMVNIPISTK